MLFVCVWLYVFEYVCMRIHTIDAVYSSEDTPPVNSLCVVNNSKWFWWCSGYCWLLLLLLLYEYIFFFVLCIITTCDIPTSIQFFANIYNVPFVQEKKKTRWITEKKKMKEKYIEQPTRKKATGVSNILPPLCVNQRCLAINSFFLSFSISLFLCRSLFLFLLLFVPFVYRISFGVHKSHAFIQIYLYTLRTQRPIFRGSS